MEETLREATSPAALHAALRSRLYGALAEALAYPDAELAGAIRSGELAEGLRELLEALDPALADGLDEAALRDAGEDEEALPVEYTRLFDVGASGPPCPLYGGLYAGDRMGVMEEAVRFYNHFGLRLAEQPRELPDHLATELEFLHFLAFREAETLEEGGDAAPFERAQRDFIERHPGRWVPRLRERVEGQEAMRFFPALLGCLGRVLEAERRRLSARHGASPRKTGAAGAREAGSAA